MIFKLSPEQQDELLCLPETGMGYQFVKAYRKNSDISETFLILNSEIVIEVEGEKANQIQTIFQEENLPKEIIFLNEVRVLPLKNLLYKVAEKPETYEISTSPDKGETFVRLSAFLNDKRIDRQNNCLLPGSYTTTEIDYLQCKQQSDNPVQRYALPNNSTIKWAFYIIPAQNDFFQKGIVAPVYHKRGGGIEAFF